MASGTIGNAHSVPPDQWRQAYDNALDELSGEKKQTLKANTPIFQRKPAAPAPASEPAPTDRAVEEAAKALSALWQTSRSKQALRPKK